MRKFIIICLLALICFSVFSAQQASADMRFSAYKGEPIPADLDFTLTVKYKDSEEISGMANIYDISDNVTKDATSYYIANAFVIGISTTYRNVPEVALTFSPFVNQKNTNLSIPVSYTLSKTTSTVTGANKVSGSGWLSGSYYYRYTSDMVLKDSSGTSVTTILISEEGTTTTLSQILATIQRSKQKNSGYSTITESNLPTTTNNTLPGLSASQSLSGEASFRLSIAEVDYQSMVANVDYVATVRLTVTAN